MISEKIVYESGKPVIESVLEGDAYYIKCPNEESIVKTIREISLAFDEPAHLINEIIDTVKKRKDWRFEGTFNLKLVRDRLFFDNRNGRGLEANRLRMKEIVGTL